MSVLSGKDGNVLAGEAAVADVVRWSLRTAAHGVSYASNATGGAKRRLAGVKEGRGEFAFKLNDAAPLTEQLAAGQKLTLALRIDAARQFSVSIVVDVVRFDVPIDPGGGDGLVGGLVEFTTDGAWTLPSF